MVNDKQYQVKSLHHRTVWRCYFDYASTKRRQAPRYVKRCKDLMKRHVITVPFLAEVTNIFEVHENKKGLKS